MKDIAIVLCVESIKKNSINNSVNITELYSLHIYKKNIYIISHAHSTFQVTFICDMRLTITRRVLKNMNSIHKKCKCTSSWNSDFCEIIIDKINENIWPLRQRFSSVKSLPRVVMVKSTLLMRQNVLEWYSYIQFPYQINVWAVISGNHIVGLLFFSGVLECYKTLFSIWNWRKYLKWEKITQKKELFRNHQYSERWIGHLGTEQNFFMSRCELLL